MDREYIVLPDLEKKMEEAEHDALNYFEKKCPYCDSLLFTGHIRNKIQIDHFIPLAKGGQHVPWNILPVCQKCNAKKNAKNPKLYLTNEKSEKCETYLRTVQEKYVGQVQQELEKYQLIKHMISSNDSMQKINQNKIALLANIYEIVTGKTILTVSPTFKNRFDLDSSLEDIIKRLYKVPDEFDRVKKYTTTELLNQIQPHISFEITRNLVGKTFRKLGFYYSSAPEWLAKEKQVKRVFYVCERN